MFHRIGEPGNDLHPLQPKDYVSVETFRAIVRTVAEHCHPISVPELMRRWHASEPIAPDSVVVTFDDGFRDNLTAALPILEEFDVPAAVYITTGFIDRSVAPLSYELAAVITSARMLRLPYQGRQHSWQLHTDDERRQCYADIYRILKPQTRDTRDHAVAILQCQCDALPNDQYRYLSWDEVSELAASPLITIGAHTHAHELQTTIPLQRMQTDVEHGARLLTERLGLQPRHFSYPHGQFNRQVQAALRSLGFQSAMSIGTRRFWQRPDPFDIRRTPVFDDFQLSDVRAA